MQNLSEFTGAVKVSFYDSYDKNKRISWVASTDKQGFPGCAGVRSMPASAGDTGSVPGLGRSTGVGKVHPLRHAGLENSVDRGAWWTTVHGVAQSQTRRNDWAYARVPESLPWGPNGLTVREPSCLKKRTPLRPEPGLTSFNAFLAILQIERGVSEGSFHPWILLFCEVTKHLRIPGSSKQNM